MFTRTQKNNLFCKCVKLSFPVFHLLLCMVSSSESLSAVREMRRSPPSMNFMLSARYIISHTNTFSTLLMKSFQNSLSNFLSKSCFQTLPGNKDRLDIAAFGNQTKHSRANYSKLALKTHFPGSSWRGKKKKISGGTCLDCVLE